MNPPIERSGIANNRSGIEAVDTGIVGEDSSGTDGGNSSRKHDYLTFL